MFLEVKTPDLLTTGRERRAGRGRGVGEEKGRDRKGNS